MVVGDDAQCLVEGTLVTMADGTKRPIEEVGVGDEVLSGNGSGDFRPAQVLRVHQLRASRRNRDHHPVGPADREHARSRPLRWIPAGPDPADAHDLPDVATRPRFPVGTSRTYANGQVKPVVGVACRVRGASADGAWVVSTHDCEADARYSEALLAAKYGLPTVPFVGEARSGPDRPVAGRRPVSARPPLLGVGYRSSRAQAAPGQRTGVRAPPLRIRDLHANRSPSPPPRDLALRRPSRPHPDAPDRALRVRRRGQACARRHRPQRPSGAPWIRRLALRDGL